MSEGPPALDWTAGLEHVCEKCGDRRVFFAPPLEPCMCVERKPRARLPRWVLAWWKLGPPELGTDHAPALLSMPGGGPPDLVLLAGESAADHETEDEAGEESDADAGAEDVRAREPGRELHSGSRREAENEDRGEHGKPGAQLAFRW